MSWSVFHYQVGINVKSNPGSNSDINNKSDSDLVLLHMLSVYIKDLTTIWQISCWKQMAYCTQKRLKLLTKNTFTHVSNKDPESTNCFCGSHWSLNACACVFVATYAHFCIIFSIDIFIFSQFYFVSSTPRVVLKSNQPIKSIVTHDLLPQKWNEKASLIGWGGFSGWL